MQVEILQEELLKAVAIALRAVSSRVQLPILSSIKIEASQTELVLTASDLEIGIKQSAKAKVLVQGRVAVPAKTFYDLLSSLKPGKIELSVVEKELLVKANGFKGKLLTVEVEEFPALPEFSEELLKIDGKDLQEVVNRVSFASARDSLRPVLTGILLELSERPRLVATDGFRLAVASLPIKGITKTGRSSLLIPARSLLECSKVIKEGELSFEFIEETKQVLFKQEGVLFVSQIIEGNFPDYSKILPKEFVSRINVSKEELLSGVKTVMVFARDNSQMMRLRVGQNKVIITAAAGSSGEGEVEIGAGVEGEQIEIVFNAKYITDYLNLLSVSEIWLGLGGKLAPGMIAENEEKKDESFYVVMPINA